MSLSLDSDHDIHRGDRSVLVLARGADEVVQGLLTRLQLFLGEWFLDVDAGTDWYGVVFTDNPDMRLVETELKRRINSQPGVEAITRFDAKDLDRGSRAFTLSFEVLTTYGPSGALEVSP